jgi:predicted Zn-dependent peptidase
MKIPFSNDIYPYKFPAWQEAEITNSYKAYLINSESTPLVNIKFVVRMGAYSEKIFGLAHLTTQLMQRGTILRDADKIASEFDDMGASFSINTGWDEIILNVHCLEDFQFRTLELALDCFLNPAFKEDEFEKYKKRQIARIDQENSDPEYLAQVNFNKTVYENSGYAHTLIGTKESIDSITLADVKSFHQEIMKSDLFFVLAGNIDNDLIKALGKDFPLKKVHQEPPTQENMYNKERTIIVDKKDASQINLRIGKKTIDRNSQDFHILSLTNTIFGGYFLSRLNKKVREEMGLTYGINSYFDNRRYLSSWQISSAINIDSLIVTLDTIESEMTNFYEKKVEFEELNIARNYMMGNFLKTLETPHQLASMLVSIKTLGLKDTYYDDFYRKINYATVDQVFRIQKKFFNSQNLILTFSGNADEISKSLLENFELDLEII